MNDLKDKIITFVIVTWNNENEISECISSIKKCTKCNYDIICIDNDSSDCTVSIIRNTFSDVYLIESEENLGFAMANNIGLAKVDTEYICFLNPDTILQEDIVIPSIEYLKDNPKIGVVGCRLLNRDRSLQPSAFKYASPFSMAEEILHFGKLFPQSVKRKFFPKYYRGRKINRTDWIIGAEMIMRTESAKEISGFSTEYYMYTEDMDLCMKVYKKLEQETVCLNHISLVHLGGASEAQSTNYVKQHKLFDNTYKFCYKFFGEEYARKTVKSMKISYIIRNILLYMFYFKSDRAKQISKSKDCYYYLRDM